MNLKNIFNKSVYGTIGYISSLDDINTLEQYILYNLDILKEFKNIIISTNYSNTEFIENNKQIWRKYFPECILLDSLINRGHTFGTADLDDMIFDYCKRNNIEWLCKSANDIILEKEILEKEVSDADFYYLNGIGYGGMIKYQFNFEEIINKDFYPQTNFYIINVSKCDYLNDKEHINLLYHHIKHIDDYNGKAWEYGLKSCEQLLRECIERNKLKVYHLIPYKKYIKLLEIIRNEHIHDCSHKNIMIEGICHFQFNNKKVISI